MMSNTRTCHRCAAPLCTTLTSSSSRDTTTRKSERGRSLARPPLLLLFTRLAAGGATSCLCDATPASPLLPIPAAQSSLTGGTPSPMMSL